MLDESTRPAPAERVLQVELPSKTASILDCAKRAERLTGRKAAEIMSEIMRLQLGETKIEPEEYFELALFDPAFTDEERRRFAGEKRGALANQSVNRIRRAAADVVSDKLLFGALLQGFGLGAPRTQAIIAARASTPLPTLTTAEDALAYLRGPARYPLFGKPVNASLSLGAASIDTFDAASDMLRLHGGGETPVAAFVGEVFEAYADGGYMLQDRLAPHPELERIAGPALGTLRVCTLHHGDDAEIHYALWKAPALGATADNFWRAGNMVADIDLETGVATRCQLGSGLDAEQVAHHPGTGARIEGAALPLWAETKQLALEAARLFPDCPILGWDVAITPEGPVVIEANTCPQHVLRQTAARKGLMTPEFAAYLAETKARLEAGAKSEVATRKGLNGRRRWKRLMNMFRINADKPAD